jgi:hypothetical protein
VIAAKAAKVRRCTRVLYEAAGELVGMQIDSAKRSARCDGLEVGFSRVRGTYL